MPAGRPKGSQPVGSKVRTHRALEFAERAYKRGAVDTALTKLIDLMENGDTPQVQLAATKEILDRTLGKPTAPIEAEVNHSAIDIMDILDEVHKRYGPNWDDMPS